MRKGDLTSCVRIVARLRKVSLMAFSAPRLDGQDPSRREGREGFLLDGFRDWIGSCMIF